MAGDNLTAPTQNAEDRIAQGSHVTKRLPLFLLLVVGAVVLLFGILAFANLGTNKSPCALSSVFLPCLIQSNPELAGGIIGAVGTVLAAILAWSAVQRQLELDASQHRETAQAVRVQSRLLAFQTASGARVNIQGRLASAQKQANQIANELAPLIAGLTDARKKIQHISVSYVLENQKRFTAVSSMIGDAAREGKNISSVEQCLFDLEDAIDTIINAAGQGGVLQEVTMLIDKPSVARVLRRPVGKGWGDAVQVLLSSWHYYREEVEKELEALRARIIEIDRMMLESPLQG